MIDNNGNVHIIKYKKKFNSSDACNYGVNNSSGEYLLFLNNDTEKVITLTTGFSRCLSMLSPEIGMVGPKLIFEDKITACWNSLIFERDIVSSVLWSG